jgi:hypothetical protein
MMPPAQLTLMLELTNERLVEKEKQEMTRQELLRWIGVCVLIAGINFSWKTPQPLGGWRHRLEVPPLLRPSRDGHATQPL